MSMADPPFAIRFRPRATEPPATEPPAAEPLIALYRDALAFAAEAARVVDVAEAARFFLRDQLDRKSAAVPQLIAQGLATDNVPARRALYRRARMLATDCAAILDLLAARGAVAAAQIEAAQARAQPLLDELRAQTVPPPQVR